MNDGLSLHSEKHSWRGGSWIKRILNRIKYFFFPPKFSEGAIEDVAWFRKAADVLEKTNLE